MRVQIHKVGNQYVKYLLESSLFIQILSGIRPGSSKYATPGGIPKLKYTKKIIVDPELGNFKTLEDAIMAADEGTVIKLSEGVYTCNIVVTKPGIKIEPRDKDKPVYLLGNQGPVIKVEMTEAHHHLVIKRLLLAHSGLNLVKKFKTVQETF